MHHLLCLFFFDFPPNPFADKKKSANFAPKTDENLKKLTMRENTRPASAIDMQVHIVGARYYFDDEAQMRNYLEKAPSLHFVMMSEPNNPVDPRAVAVCVVGHECLRPVGHISREDLPKVHRMMDAR